MLALGVSVLIPSSLLCLAHATQAANKPNFLILFADDMGYGDMSINGNPQFTLHIWTPWQQKACASRNGTAGFTSVLRREHQC